MTRVTNASTGTSIGTDFTVFDGSGSVVARVEAKSKRGTSPMWAARMRSNIVSHTANPKPQFFMIATSDAFYIWDDAAELSATALPNVVIPPNAVLQAREATPPSPGIAEVEGLAFELVVADWLGRLVRGELDVDSLPLNVRRFAKAVRDGHLRYEMAA